MLDLSAHDAPAISRCTQGSPFVNSSRKSEAVIQPAGLPGEFFRSATSDFSIFLYSFSRGSLQIFSLDKIDAALKSLNIASSDANVAITFSPRATTAAPVKVALLRLADEGRLHVDADGTPAEALKVSIESDWNLTPITPGY